ncbi:hypothetical protein Hanom_Chr15g01404701 [Helianthus anomalus]
MLIYLRRWRTYKQPRLTEGVQLLAKNIHKGPEMTQAMAAVNNAMSVIGVNSGVHGGYRHALKKKTPYGEVPLFNQNAEAELNTVIACFDSLTFLVVNDLPNLVNEPLSKIKIPCSLPEELQRKIEEDIPGSLGYAPLYILVSEFFEGGHIW